MPSILFVASRGSDDPTMATFPFEMAVGAAKGGNEVHLALLNEAVYLVKDEVVGELQGFGCSPFKEVLEETVDFKIPIYV